MPPMQRCKDTVIFLSFRADTKQPRLNQARHDVYAVNDHTG